MSRAKQLLFALAVLVLAVVVFVAARQPLQTDYYQTSAVAASGVVTATGRNYFFAISGYNNNTSAQFIQLFDSATVPADATVPKIVFRAEGSRNFYYDTFDRGVFFTNGISWSNSSTLATKTIGSADVMVTGVEYR